MFDISKIQSSSLTPGLRDLGTISGSTTISGTIAGVPGSKQGTIDLVLPDVNVITVMRVNMSGGNLDNYWFPLMGSLGLYDALTLSPLANAYYALFLVQGISSGRRVNIDVSNQRASGALTLPTLTITIYAHLYSYPW